jgi:hypothetical protein
MIDKKKGEQQTSSAESSAEPPTQPVVDLLTSILSDVQTQVRRKTPKPLEGDAVEAVDLFREIGATLALQPIIRPTITLTAREPTLVVPGNVTLTWSSTRAETVSIDNGVGEVTPPAGGSKDVLVSALGKTIFTATAVGKGPCGAKATAEVTGNSLV